MKKILLILFCIAALHGNGTRVLADASPSGQIFSVVPQQDSYRQHIRKADRLFAARKYQAAIIEYKKALELKPGDSYAEKRISEIYEKTGIKPISPRTYEEKIALADQYYRQRKYEQALSWYRVAGAMKPEETYPGKMIKKIRKEQNQISERNQDYRQTLQDAEQLYEKKAYIEAREKYKKALQLFPARPYPQEMIQKIDEKLNEDEQEESGYQDAIRTGIAYMDKADYYKAKRSFETALRYKANDTLAKHKISAINDSLAAAGERRKAYALLIQQGNRHFAQKKYSLARQDYSQAIKIENKSYPHKKLYEINRLLRQHVKEEASAYDKLVREGDKYYAGMLYLQAISMYEKAGKQDPSKDYPGKMIRKIKELLAHRGLRTMVQSTIQLPKNNKRKFYFKPIAISQRSSNFIYLRLRNRSAGEVKVYFSFGKDDQESGGYDFRMKAKEEKKIIVPVGKKDPWFSIDNNYVSIYSRRGDLNVEELKILRNNEDR